MRRNWQVPAPRSNFSRHARTIYRTHYWDSTPRNNSPSGFRPQSKWNSSQNSGEQNPNDRHKPRDAPGGSREPGNNWHTQRDTSRDAAERPASNQHKRWNPSEETAEQPANNQHKRQDTSGEPAEQPAYNKHKRWGTPEETGENVASNHRKRWDESQNNCNRGRQSPERSDTNKARHTPFNNESINPNTSRPQDTHENPNFQYGGNPVAWMEYWQNQSYGDPQNFYGNFYGMQNNFGCFSGGTGEQGNFQYGNYSNVGGYWQAAGWEMAGQYHVWNDGAPEGPYPQSLPPKEKGNEEVPAVKEDKSKRKKKEEDKNEAPILGSEEEKLKTRKATTEWLKERIKNKDLSQFDTLLKEKSKQKVPETQPKSTRKETINFLDSALDASSIEAIEKNLADVLPSEDSLLTSLLKDPGLEGIKLGTGHQKKLFTSSLEATNNSAKVEKVISQTQSTNVDAGNAVNVGSVSTASPPGKVVKPSPAPGTGSVAGSSGSKIQISNSSSSLKVSKNDKDKFSRLIRLLTKGQIRDLLTNPRPGKFEYLLKQQVRKHRLESSREIRLSKESGASTGNNADDLICETDIQEGETFELPFSEDGLDTDLVINMNDLPLEFIQELHDALGSNISDNEECFPLFSGTEDESSIAAEENEMPVRTGTPKPNTEHDKASQSPLLDKCTEDTFGKQPETCAKMFASNANAKTMPPQQESSGRISILESHKGNSSTEDSSSELSYSDTVKTEKNEDDVEADTTVEPSCPLGGPSLLEESMASTAFKTFSSLTTTNPQFIKNEGGNTKIPQGSKNIQAEFSNFSPFNKRNKEVDNILKQEVFFSAEDNGKKKKKAGKGSSCKKTKPKKKVLDKKKFAGAAKFIDHSEPGSTRPSSVADFIASRSGTVASQLTIPDSTCAEPVPEKSVLQSAMLASSGKSTDTTPVSQIIDEVVLDSETAEEDGLRSPSPPKQAPRSPSPPKHAPDLKNLTDEVTILSEILNRAKELQDLEKRRIQLQQEKDYLTHKFNKISAASSSQESKPKQKDSKRKSSEKGTGNKRPRRLDSSSTSELATSDNESVLSSEYSGGKKHAKQRGRAVKRGSSLSRTPARYTSASSTHSDSTPYRKLLLEAQESITYEKHSLGYYTSKLSLTCSSFPEDIGIITQVKVIRKLVLASSSVGKVFAFNSSNGTIRRTYGDGKFPVKCFLIDEKKIKSKHETRLYFGTGDGHLHCYTMSTGDLVHPPILVSSDIMCMDAKWGFVYMGTKSGSVVRYNIETESLERESLSNDLSSISAINLSNEGPRKVLIVASENQPIVLRDASSGLLLRTVTRTWTGRWYKCALGVNLVFCNTNRDIFAFSYSNGDLINTYNVPATVTCISVWRKVLYVGCSDGSVRKFDTETHKPLGVLQGPNHVNVVCMDILEDKVLVAKRGGLLEVLNNN